MPEGWTKLQPEHLGVLLAMFTAIIRVIYDQEETKIVRIAMESVICGGLSLTTSAAIHALNLDLNWAIFAGGAIGFMGTAMVRGFALKLINKNVG